MNVEIFALLEIEGKKFPLTSNRNYLVGRKVDGVDKLDIILQSETVDAKHAVIRICEDKTKILDLHSKSGTFINKQRLENLNEMLLEDSDTLQIGDLVGSIRYSEIESHNSSGFHEGPKNKSNIVCSTPEPSNLSTSHLIQIRQNSVTFIPNDISKYSNEAVNSGRVSSIVPAVLTRKSYDSNNGQQHSMNVPCTQAVNDSLGNKTDSFTIPETQQCVGGNSSTGRSLECNSTGISDEGVANMLYSHDENDNDSCIPETQDIVERCNSQLQKRHHNEQATFQTNTTANVLNEENINDVDLIGGSQIRICTQDYNEVNYLDDDSNNSDLLADVPCSFIIPHIKHDPVILDASGRPMETIGANKERLSDDNKHTLTNLVEERESYKCLAAKHDNDKELSTIQWPERNSNCPEELERDDMCTPDLFDIPELADLNTKENDDEATALQTNDNAVKEVEGASEKRSSSFKVPSEHHPKTALKQSDLSVCEDSDDLIPTQIFTKPEAVDFKKSTTNDCLQAEYLTLSDKENMTPAAVAALEVAEELMEQTQVFVSVGTNSTSSNVKENESLPAPTRMNAVETSSTTDEHHPISPGPAMEKDDNDLSPTQVFLCPSKTKAIAAGNRSLSKTSCVAGNITLEPSNIRYEDNATTTLLAIKDQHTPLKATQTFHKPAGVGNLLKKPSLNASMSESPDLDMLLCTPRLICDNFKQPETKVKEDLLSKHKTLFGDDSDEDSDALQMITESKVSRDFDKLLPHLKNNQVSPKRKESEAELHKFKRTFGESDGKKKRHLREGGVKNMASRDERHEARDKTREKVVENLAEKKHKYEHKTKQTKDAEKQTVDNKNEVTREVRVRLQRKRRKEMETNDDCDTNSNSKMKKEAKTSHKHTEKEEVKKKEKESTRRNIAEKPEQQEDTSSRSSRVTRSRRKQSQSKSASVNESPVELAIPCRRTTRLKSRLQELTTDESGSTKATEIKPNKRSESGRAQEVDKTVEETHSSAQNQVTEIKHKTKSKDFTSQSAKDVSKDKANMSRESERKRTLRNTETRTSVDSERKRLRSSDTLNDARTDNISPAPSSTSSLRSTRHTKKLKVSMTMVDSEHFESLAGNSSGIWCITADPIECDILIMDKANRTFKLLIALARGIPIVTSSWLESVNQKRDIVSVSEHFYADEAFEKRHKFSLIKSIDMARKRKLLAGYQFLMTPDIRPQPHEISAIIKCAGGTVHVDVPASSRDIRNLYLISTKNERKLWHKYRRLSGDVRIISTEGIMSAVMRQSLKPLDSNLLA